MRQVAAHFRIAAGKDIGVLEDFCLPVGRDEIGKDGDNGIDQDQQNPQRRRHRHRAEQLFRRPGADMAAELLEQETDNAEPDDTVHGPSEEGRPGVHPRTKIQCNALIEGDTKKAVTESAGRGDVAQPFNRSGAAELAAAEKQRQCAGDDEGGPIGKWQGWHHASPISAAAGAGWRGST